MLRTQPQIGELIKLRLNITVIGETGIGKTTFLKTLFKRYCSNEAIRSILSTSTTKTVMIEKIGGFEISSGAVKCAIELTDCPGFGDFVDNRCAIRTVADFLKKGHDDWLTSNTNWVSPEVSILFKILILLRTSLINIAFLCMCTQIVSKLFPTEALYLGQSNPLPILLYCTSSYQVYWQGSDQTAEWSRSDGARNS